MTDPIAASAPSAPRLGPIQLSPGVARANVLTLFFAGALTMAFVNIIVLLQPYLFHEHLHLPTEIQGNFTGNLTVFAEIIMLMLVVPVGSLSDRFGRRPIFVTALLVFAAALALLPLATTRLEFFAARGLFAVGAALALPMISAMIADYPDNDSRGKMISANGICTGIGLVLIASFGFAQLPELLTSRGYEPQQAGIYTFWFAAGLAVFTAVVASRGLKGGRIDSSAEQRPRLLEQIRVGFGKLRGSPRLRLAAGATFVSRGDLTVLAGFFTLWLVAVGTDQGMQAADAQAQAGRLFGVSQLAMLLFIPIMGVAVDRMDRVTALIIAMGIAAIGYTALGLVQNPLGSPVIYVVALMAGAGEAAVIVSAPALVGQEAPVKSRGSIIGFMSLLGALGVLINVKWSGVMFDNWFYQAPFLWMGMLNALVCLWAAVVRWRFGVSPLDTSAPQQRA